MLGIFYFLCAALLFNRIRILKKRKDYPYDI